MVDFGIKRNGSGYYDETPYKAVMGMPKAGEVWSTTHDKLFLILKNHGKYCTTLALNETNRDNECLAVTVEYPLYTNPAMLGYTFNSFFCEFIKRIPDEEYMVIMDEVSARLGVTIKRTIIAEKDETTQADREAWQDAMKQLENECEQLKEERNKIAEVERATRAEMMVYKERAESIVPVPAPDPAAAMYKQMYYELLDRIITRG